MHNIGQFPAPLLLQIPRCYTNAFVVVAAAAVIITVVYIKTKSKSGIVVGNRLITVIIAVMFLMIFPMLTCTKTVCWLKETMHGESWSQSTELSASWVWCTLPGRIAFPAQWGCSASWWPVAESLQVNTPASFLYVKNCNNCSKSRLLSWLCTFPHVCYNLFVVFKYKLLFSSLWWMLPVRWSTPH